MRYSVLLAVLAAVVCGLSLVSAQKIALEWVKKLEEFGADPTKTSTGMTYKDYVEGFEDLMKSFSVEYFEKRREISAKFRLLDDLVIMPMDHWRISDDAEDIYKRAYVSRLETAYKRFWPAYVRKETIEGGTRYRAGNLLKFAREALEPTEKDLSLKDWNNAYAQYKSLIDWMDELVREQDIYYHLDDYAQAMNTVNWDRTKAILTFADEFEKCNNDEEFKEALARYRKRFTLG